ncbi:helix-turn-helix domain-containing protein [Rosistilla oblonga]|uniref:helix-turn-helix domain-containing protein n=1 Tax=Rosistilla oblonga TaxID=2527990 RepID=UPI003A9702E8
MFAHDLDCIGKNPNLQASFFQSDKNMGKCDFPRIMTEEIPERLARLLKERGLRMKPVSLAAGLGETAVTDIIRRRAQSPRMETLTKIASAIGISPQELIHGEVSARDKLHHSVTSETQQDLPIYGDPNTMDNSFDLNAGRPIDFIARPAILANNTKAFACYVTGDAMQPRYYRGELLLIDPVRPFQVTDFVLIEKTDGTAQIRLLNEIGKESVTVTQLNPEQDQDIKRQDIKRIYKIAGSYDI